MTTSTAIMRAETPTERELLQRFREMSARQQSAFLKMLKAMVAYSQTMLDDQRDAA